MLPKGAIRLQKGAGGLPKGASKVTKRNKSGYNKEQKVTKRSTVLLLVTFWLRKGAG